MGARILSLGENFNLIRLNYARSEVLMAASMKMGVF
jgi:hypothetical protein